MSRKSHFLTLNQISDDINCNPIAKKNYLIEKWRREKSWQFFEENPTIDDVYLIITNNHQEWIAAKDEYYW